MVEKEILIAGDTTFQFEIQKGRAKAILPEEKDKPYYKHVLTGDREFDTALDERIERPFKDGMLVVRNPDGTIKFDDRKIRYDGFSKEGTLYRIRVGPTHFGEMGADIKASQDQDFSRAVQEKGTQDFSDASAYFANCLAVNAVPVTADGIVHVFRRDASAQYYPNH